MKSASEPTVLGILGSGRQKGDLWKVIHESDASDGDGDES
jgi:hypothetical protein